MTGLQVLAGCQHKLAMQLKDTSEDLLKGLNPEHRDKINKCYDQVIDNLSYIKAGLDQWSIYRESPEVSYDNWVEDYKSDDSFSIDITSESFRNNYLYSVSPNTLGGGTYSKSTLYAYVHGGVSVSLIPFNCQWDSGPIGFVWYKEGLNPCNLIVSLNDVLQGYTSYVLESSEERHYFNERMEALDYLKEVIKEGDEILLNKWLDENFNRRMGVA